MAANVLERALAALDHPAPILPDGPLPEMPPDHAATMRRGLRPAPQPYDEPTLSIDEAQQMIRSRAAAYLAEPMPSRIQLVAAPAGIGKTTMAVELIERHAMAGHRVMYVGPRRDFFADIREVSRNVGLIPPAAFDRWWYAWEGRHSGNDTEPSTCRFPEQIATWQQRGYKALDFCSNPRICGWNIINHTCLYHAQKRQRQPIIFAQYEHISMGHPLLDQCSLVVGDELPLRAFLYDSAGQPGWVIPPQQIVPPDMPSGPLADLLARLRLYTSIPNREALTWHGPDLLAGLGGAAHVQAVCEAATIDGSAVAYSPELRTASDADDAPYFHLKELIPLLLREAKAEIAGTRQIPRVHVSARGLQLLIRRVPANLPPHVIWLDATANARMYQTIFQREIEVVQPVVKLAGRIHQVWPSLNNKGQLMDGAESAPAKTTALRQQIAQVLTRGYRDVAYIGYKGIIDRLVPPGTPEGRIAHFGGSRGTNRLEGCDCLIVVGTPQPTIAAMTDIGAMLYAKREIAFDPTFTLRDVPFTGQPWAYPINGFWNDADLQTILEQFREAELTQAVHRARPLRHAVDVWLFTSAPIPGLPVQLIGLHALYGALDAAGQPLPIKDPSRWPALVDYAEAACAELGEVTTPMVSTAFGVSAPTARGWLECLIATGSWRRTTATTSTNNRAPFAVCKAFRQDFD